MNTDSETLSQTNGDKYVPRKDRRPSRYVKAQQRRAAAKANDNRFYAAIFTLISVVVLFSLSISAVMVNGGSVDTSGMTGWATPWVLGMSKLEVIGLGLVGIVAVIMWRKMKK